MSDDIVTRLRMPVCGNYDDDHPSWGPQPCSSCIEAADEIERLRNIANRLGTHLGQGLYTDNWECREYAIAAYAAWEIMEGAALYAYDVAPKPVWYFKNGESV